MKKDIFLKYCTAVMALYKVEMGVFFSNSKNKDASEARYMVYYLCQQRDIMVTHIQKYMAQEGYDPSHCAVHRGIKKIKERVAEDRDYATIVSRIENSTFI